MSTDPTLRVVEPSPEPDVEARISGLRGGLLKYLMKQNEPRPMCCGCDPACDGSCAPEPRPAA